MKHQGGQMGQSNQNANIQNELNPRELNRALILLSSTSPGNGSDQRLPNILSGPNPFLYPESCNIIPTNDLNVGVLPREPIGPLLRTNISSSSSVPGSVQRFLGPCSHFLAAENPDPNCRIERHVVEEGTSTNTRVMSLKRKSLECDLIEEFTICESSSMGAQARISKQRATLSIGSPTQISPNPSHSNPSQNFATQLVNSINENQRISVARPMNQVPSALEHLRNGGSLGSEERMMLDSAIALTLLEAQNDIDEEDDSEEDEEIMGLTEEEILSNIRRENFQSITDETDQESEACCICQEDYVNNEELGKLDCGHRFHLACITPWLVLNNTCPICKQMALAIDLEEEGEEDYDL